MKEKKKVYNYNRFKIVLKNLSEDEYIAEGIMSIDGKKHSYLASGNLMTFDLDCGSTGLIGVLSGYVTDLEEHLNLSIHAIPNENKIFVFATVGMLSETTDFEELIFGKTFKQMDELVEKFVLIDKSNALECTRETGNLEEFSIGALSLSNDVRKLRGVSVGGATWYGQYYPMAYLTLYTSELIKDRTPYKNFIKINSNVNNAIVYVRDRYPRFGILDVWVSRGNLAMSGNHTEFELSNLDPISRNATIDLPIPYWLNGSFGWLPFSIKVTKSQITATNDRTDSEKLHRNRARWTLSYRTNIDVNITSTGAADPAGSKRGYTGSATMIHYDSRPATIPYTASGSVTYTYQYRNTLETFIASFTVSAPSFTVPIHVNVNVYPW